MTSSATNVQLIAQQNIRDLIRAVAQNKWTMAYTDELALKISLVNSKIEIKNLIGKAYGFLCGAYISSVKDEPIYKLISKVQALSGKDIAAEVEKFKAAKSKELIASAEQLRAASLSDKRAVMRAVHVVGMPIAAAYLGTTTRCLNEFTNEHVRVIGDRYAGGYCLSIDEVFLIEQNKKWLGDSTSAVQVAERDQIKEDVFYHMLFVGADVACAYTDMTLPELSKNVAQGAQSRRPYRLSDLEKIRVAKLNATN